jgi:hypothetical protein
MVVYCNVLYKTLLYLPLCKDAGIELRTVAT